MKKNVDMKALGIFASLLLLVGVCAGFAWLYLSSEKAASNSVIVDSAYQTVEIESVKKDAENLLKDRENTSGLPLKNPDSTVMGRENPFAGL